MAAQRSMVESPWFLDPGFCSDIFDFWGFGWSLSCMALGKVPPRRISFSRLHLMLGGLARITDEHHYRRGGDVHYESTTGSRKGGRDRGIMCRKQAPFPAKSKR
ncbi:hypothetical protein HRR83_006768 [Exophiala dermatitidis]|uniref:Uncharacterized protein n=1 Tax=Exophiala dermatitidis TaxID=5970 RepID=A0AAN6ETB7_EXODE|nr:hypothetical protein HRR74_005929 [Exophiala dermatitidis]KAJ4515247.1 hypothetical protein HRR73_005077 [Exophiala dermatitidis]KAJ4535349.1 hypothetical protein HRR77_007967 [Exophiala dermatitidis]KAJ4540770.1 hypothetical protein HRR76_004155 [Exophiala dermatitidis]KAJ4556968.1 hypothetical protein HRR79_008773 [Exophiala dermatitidis]